MPYSVQPYAVRAAVEADLPGAIRRIAEIGFAQVGPYDFTSGRGAPGAVRSNRPHGTRRHALVLTADQDEILSRAQRLGNEIAIKPLFPTDRWQNAKRAGNPLSPSFEDDVQMQCVLAAIKESAAAKSTTIQI